MVAVSISEGVEQSAITSTTNVWDKMPKIQCADKNCSILLGRMKLTLDIQKTLERFWDLKNVEILSRSINITNSRSINITIMRKKKSKMINRNFKAREPPH